MKHLTRFFPRKAARKAVRRALAALLCVTTLGGGAAVFAADEQSTPIPSQSLPTAEVKVAETEAGYYYYWRNAANGGMPVTNNKETKIPVIIVWNDKYYMRADDHFADTLDAMYPHLDGRNCAYALPYYDGDILAPASTCNLGDSAMYYVDGLRGSGTRQSWGGSGKIQSLSDWGESYTWKRISGKVRVWADGKKYDTAETISNYQKWDSGLYDDFWYTSPCLMANYRHYPMRGNALVSNLQLYNDIKATGYAMTDEIPAGLPFLLDCGTMEVNPGYEGASMTHYAIGFFADSSQTSTRFLYGGLNTRSDRNTSNDSKRDNNNTLWKWVSTYDWFMDYKNRTVEQWVSPNFNINDSEGRRFKPDNKDLRQRTWTFGMTANGQFTIRTDGIWNNNKIAYNYSGETEFSQDRVNLLNSGTGYYATEGWLWHRSSGHRYENWLGYYGTRNKQQSHTGRAEKTQNAFTVYVGEPQICSYLKNSFTVQAGQTVTIDGPVVLKQGNTITVEDGGVLSISGWVTNNGVINIKPGGKMIIQHRESTTGDYQEGLLVSTAKPGTSYGCVNCDGTLIVMSDATVIGGGLNGLRFGESAQVVNYGTLAAENFTVYRDNTIENRGDTSRVFCGWGVTGNGYGLTRTKNDGGSSFLDMGRVESASAVQLAANAVYGARANAVYFNNVSGVTVSQGMANRTGRVTGAGATSGDATAQKIAAQIIDFDPAEWEKYYLPETKKVKV